MSQDETILTGHKYGDLDEGTEVEAGRPNDEHRAGRREDEPDEPTIEPEPDHG